MIYILLMCVTPQHGLWIWSFPGKEICTRTGKFTSEAECRAEGYRRTHRALYDGFDDDSYKGRWERLSTYDICVKERP
jgi:hypothetical protein